jgi:hypothetical protein
MPNFASVAEWIAFRPTPPGGFRGRLAATVLATILDFTVIAMVGPAVVQCASISWLVPFVFSILVLALFSVLGHMWLLTLKGWNCR